MEQRIVPVTHQFEWQGAAVAWTPGYAHLGNVGTSWENPGNWIDLQTLGVAVTLPQVGDYVGFGTLDKGPCVVNANETIGNMDFLNINHVPSLEILAGVILKVHNDAANQKKDALGHFNESVLASGPTGTIKIDGGVFVHTGGQLKFHGGNTVWNATTVSVDNPGLFKGDIFLDGGGTLHLGKTVAPISTNAGISDSAHFWIGYNSTLAGGDYTKDGTADMLYVDTFDTGKNLVLANGADIYLCPVNPAGGHGIMKLDADEANANGSIIDISGNSQIFAYGEMDRTEVIHSFNAQVLSVNVTVDNFGTVFVDDSCYLSILGSGTSAYSLLMDSGSIQIGSNNGGAHLIVGTAAHQGYSQTGGTLMYGASSQYFDGNGTISAGYVQCATNAYGNLFLIDGTWAIKGTTVLEFRIDGSTSGSNDSITIQSNHTLTIGDDATHNNVVIDTYIQNQAPTRNNQYTVLKSGINGVVTILDSSALTIKVDATSPFGATWSDVNSTWGTNLVLTEQ